MSWHKKVAWLEGMFIRPQHFQQQDRYVEGMVSSLNAQLTSYGWGVSELDIDESALRLGNIVIRRCRAILPDGTPINVPAEDDVPEPISLSVEDEGGLIYLGLPLWRAGAKEMDRQAAPDANARFRIDNIEVSDVVMGSRSLADVEVAGKKLSVLSQQQYHQQYSAIPIARVKLIKNRSVILDEGFIPPALDFLAVEGLGRSLKEIHGLTHMRSEALAERIKSTSGGGSAEMADFLLLQLLNRYEPMLAHYLVSDQLHPQTVYQTLIQFAGELATFTHPDKKVAEMPVYQHLDLEATFTALEQLLQQPLSTMLDQSAVLIELSEKGFGIRVGFIPETEIAATNFVLSVRADMPREDLRRLFPVQAKVGPIEQINNLVNRQLPGVRIEPLPVAPRQVPYYSGAVYFELDTQGQWWNVIHASKGLALHIGNQFPGVKLELWAIK
ncbi:type VI secretion system baseplate subunit TssK [Neptunomonas phycophila]|uniref:Type VI secretion system baseplate subunit TssK n=1 Tax=Neptunomonas phycophila TaxID=1572645 RepID=A0ABT9ET72_9GAMM|nr:type VI secretion system baseplate subunit TssK [Neptunomonas phycophila]MDP2522181.1 type VI secretion system baseplate subunit TssK [Neptunomonas phycophila]